MIFINDDNIREKTSVALGIFDGVHLGHRDILNTAKEYTDNGLEFAVFTFRTSSVKKKHGNPYEYIYTESQKNFIFSEMGVKYIYAPDIELLKNMSGEEFSRKILRERMNAQVVVCGENFRFGKGASCGVTELEVFGKKYGFEVCVRKILERDGIKISSGQIKEYLKNGEISKANELLGENYFIMGEVVTGNRIGRTINFPTLNQLFDIRQTIPKKGAYAACCEIFGDKYSAVTNIGVKPTVEKNIKPLAETHISGFCGDLYGKNVKVDFVEFLREERKFPSLEQLKNQIEHDLNRAKELYLSK
ncbi:MAG: bifunctional riboflavin kinase/FAD synthetase [Oscillospiraceae bacterium]|nr:bifunctional riboflavin kinase/FAD synthetase [Oscillospiraceae bacterium]